MVYFVKVTAFAKLEWQPGVGDQVRQIQASTDVLFRAHQTSMGDGQGGTWLIGILFGL